MGSCLMGSCVKGSRLVGLNAPGKSLVLSDPIHSEFGCGVCLALALGGSGRMAGIGSSRDRVYCLEMGSGNGLEKKI